MSPTTTKYYSDGRQLVQQLDDSDVVEFDYLRGPTGLDRQYEVSGTKKRMYIKDPLGTVWAMVDPSNLSVKHYNYNAWGEHFDKDDTDFPTDTNYMRYISSRIEAFGDSTAQTDAIYHLDHRHYLPVLGGFIERDPLAMFGNPNFYRIFQHRQIVHGGPPKKKPFSQVPMRCDQQHSAPINALRKPLEAYIYASSDPVNNNDPSGLYTDQGCGWNHPPEPIDHWTAWAFSFGSEILCVWKCFIYEYGYISTPNYWCWPPIKWPDFKGYRIAYNIEPLEIYLGKDVHEITNWKDWGTRHSYKRNFLLAGPYITDYFGCLLIFRVRCLYQDLSYEYNHDWYYYKKHHGFPKELENVTLGTFNQCSTEAIGPGDQNSPDHYNHIQADFQHSIWHKGICSNDV